MPQINCKFQLKLKWNNYCVFFALVNTNNTDNTNGNSINTIFTIKDTKLQFPVVTLSVIDNQKFSERFSKGFEESIYQNEHKTKSEIKKLD